jgi:two-component system, OmpR family, sensor histidine kinase VicK
MILCFLTDITLDNIPHVKKLMKITEIRHLDNIRGNFGLVDRKWYHASANSHEVEGISQQIFATTREFVDQQQLFFDTLWSKAILAKNRIKEIEEGLKREVTETTEDPIEIQNLISKVITSANRRKNSLQYSSTYTGHYSRNIHTEKRTPSIFCRSDP